LKGDGEIGEIRREEFPFRWNMEEEPPAIPADQSPARENRKAASEGVKRRRKEDDREKR
jgi:hypothetical protein